MLYKIFLSLHTESTRASGTMFSWWLYLISIHSIPEFNIPLQRHRFLKIWCKHSFGGWADQTSVGEGQRTRGCNLTKDIFVFLNAISQDYLEGLSSKINVRGHGWHCWKGLMRFYIQIVKGQLHCEIMMLCKRASYSVLLEMAIT